MRHLEVIADRYRLAVQDDGRPLALFAPATSAGHYFYNEDEVRTAIVASTGWCVALEPQAFARGWCAFLAVAIGRRYEGYDFDRWRQLGSDGVAELWVGARTDGPDPQRVLSLAYTTGSAVLRRDARFADAGLLHPRGSALVFSPWNSAIGVVEYQSAKRVMAEALAELFDLPAVEPRAEPA